MSAHSKSCSGGKNIQSPLNATAAGRSIMNRVAHPITLRVLVPGEVARAAKALDDADNNANNDFKTQDLNSADRLRKRPLI